LSRVLSARFTAPALLASAILLGTVPAWGQTEQERAGARVAAQEGYKAFFEQRWSDALDLFTRAESLVHAPPHLLFIARSKEKLGQLVAAREAYMRVIKENIDPGAPKAFHDAQENAKQELPNLEPRIPYITVSVKGADAGEQFAVMIDGKQLPAALVGLPTPIDPGEHTFEARANGKSSEKAKQSSAEAAHDKVTLELKPDPNATLPGTDKATPAGEEGKGGKGADDEKAGSHADASLDSGGGKPNGGMRIGSYAAFGVGAIGLGAGVIFTLQSSSKRKQVLELCPDPSACDSANRDKAMELNNSAGSAQTLATVGYIVGGVGIAAGVTLFILSSGGSKEQPPTTAGLHVTPYFGVGSAGVIGRF
jgi:hypothetical protein